MGVNEKCFLYMTLRSGFSQQHNSNNNAVGQVCLKTWQESPLPKAQVLLLTHGPNFTLTPRHPPYGEYIATVEQAC